MSVNPAIRIVMTDKKVISLTSGSGDKWRILLYGIMIIPKNDNKAIHLPWHRIHEAIESQ